jgi:hypothetical protein
LLLGNGEKREAGQNRKTDRPGNQVLSSHLTAPIQPHQNQRVPQLLSILTRRNSSIGEARAETSIASTVARLPQRAARLPCALHARHLQTLDHAADSTYAMMEL